ncbi:MAG: diguanylate cyclase [Granulosicoccus sp.]
MGIRNKLVLCLLAVLFPLVAVAMFATHLFERQMTERTMAALANTQRLEAARIEQILDGYANHARSLAAGAHVREFFASLHDYHNTDATEGLDEHAQTTVIGGLDGFAIIDPETQWPLQQLALALQRKAGIIGSSIVELQLVNREGETMGETMGFTWIPTDPKLIERSMRTVKTHFGDAFISLDEQQRLGIVSPVMSRNGEVVGALVMESRLSPIINLISKHEDMGRSIEAHIAQPTPEADAQFITPLRFDRTAAFNKVVPESRGLAVNLALRSPESQVIKALDYRGVESYLSFQTIPETGWGLIVKIDVEETHAPVIKLRTLLGWATAASIGFIALIYLFFLVPVARRLNKAAAAARQIMDGNLSARLVDHSNDEITELASSINLLARDLEDDQKKRSEIEARLRHQALHDELTGLLNRKHANKVIDQLTEDREQEHSVMFLDLNGFKDVNDFYGHAAGDDVLKEIATRLSAQVPEGSTLARWGGDEFVVILPGANEAEATDFALTLHNVFDEPVDSSEGRHSISCSIGLATANKEVSLADALVEADSLMYEQKKRQRFHRTKGGMATRSVERAIAEKRMEMWFQPIVRLQRPGNYALVGADTDLRMRSGQGGYILSKEFMRELKDAKVLRELDNRTVELALQALRRWNLAGIVDERFRLSIKLSEQTLNDPAFPILLEHMLVSLGVLPTQIQLEFPTNGRAINETALAQLRDLDIPVALDGVDTEPNLLRHVPVTQPAVAIIGMPFLDDTVVIPHLMNTCKDMQVEVMARNVDDREQLSKLHALGVTQFQGSLFEQPVKAVDFVSRWGQTRLTGLGQAMTQTAGLRLAG